MKYFLNESERKASGGTCYHEFFKGRWNEERDFFWNDDSLYIHDDWLYSLGMDEIICKTVKKYNPFGETEIRKEQWIQIVKEAEIVGGELLEAMKEVTPWVEENFTQNDTFTILGI